MFSKNGNSQTHSDNAKMPYNAMRNVADQLQSFMDRIQIIVVDCGRNETKVRFPNGRNYSFPSRVVETKIADNAIHYGGEDGGQRKTTSLTIGYRGKYYHVGNRALSVNSELRTNFDSKISVNSVVLTLAACWLGELEGKKDIYLVFGLPMDDFDKKKYLKTCKSLSNLLAKNHEVEIEGKKHNFEIKEVIFPYECASGYFDVFRHERERLTGKDILFIDVGAATTQAAFYAWGEGVHTLIPEKSFCLPEGYDHRGSKPISEVCETIFQKSNQIGMRQENLVVVTMGRAFEALAKPIEKLFNQGKGSRVEVIASKNGTYTNVEGMGVRAKNQIYRQTKKQLEQSAGMA